MDNMDDTQAEPSVQPDSSAPASVPPSTLDDMEVDTTPSVPAEIEGEKGDTLAGVSGGAAAPVPAPDVNTGTEVPLTNPAAAMDVEEERTNSGVLKIDPDDEDGQQGGDMEQVEEKEPPAPVMSQAELDERIRDVQTTVARQQAVTMHKLVEKCKPMINPTALAKDAPAIKLLWQRRPKAQEMKAPIVDAPEIQLLALLNSDNKMTHLPHAEAFVLLCTKIQRDETKVLFLHTVDQMMEDDCRLEFVRRGGLLVVKHWMQQWNEEKRLKLLHFLLIVLKNLPLTYDMKQPLSTSGIGKMIKRVQKRWSKQEDQSLQDREGAPVFRVAGEVMATWSSRMNETKPAELKGNAAAEDASVAASTDTGRPDDVKTEVGSKGEDPFAPSVSRANALGPAGSSDSLSTTISSAVPPSKGRTGDAEPLKPPVPRPSVEKAVPPPAPFHRQPKITPFTAWHKPRTLDFPPEHFKSPPESQEAPRFDAEYKKRQEVRYVHEDHMPDTPKEQPGVDKEVSGHSVAEEGKLPLLSDEEIAFLEGRGPDPDPLPLAAAPVLPIPPPTTAPAPRKGGEQALPHVQKALLANPTLLTFITVGGGQVDPSKLSLITSMVDAVAPLDPIAQARLLAVPHRLQPLVLPNGTLDMPRVQQLLRELEAQQPPVHLPPAFPFPPHQAPPLPTPAPFPLFPPPNLPMPPTGPAPSMVSVFHPPGPPNPMPPNARPPPPQFPPGNFERDNGAGRGQPPPGPGNDYRDERQRGGRGEHRPDDFRGDRYGPPGYERDREMGNMEREGGGPRDRDHGPRSDPRRNRINKVCSFWQSHRCEKAERCDFLHEGPGGCLPAGTSRSGNADGGRGRDSRDRSRSRERDQGRERDRSRDRDRPRGGRRDEGGRPPFGMGERRDDRRR